MPRKLRAVFFVASAALLWSLDSIFRLRSLQALDPLLIVFWEHVFGLLFLIPFVPRKQLREDWKKFHPRDILPLLVLGLGGSALGGIFYSEGLHLLGPSANNIFQMIQPVFVLILAYFLLKEKASGIFFQWSLWIVISAVVICIPDFTFGYQEQSSQNLWTGVFCGLMAAFLWGCSTVAGKWLLGIYSISVLLLFRWTVATLSLFVIIVSRGLSFHSEVLFSWNEFMTFFILASVVGVLPMGIYYRGLRELPASMATFIELFYPIFGIFLPAVINHTQLAEVQWLGGIAAFIGIIFLIMMDVGFNSKKL